MKVFTAQQMRNLEAQAYQDSASEEFFMEQAGASIAQMVEEYLNIHQLTKYIILLCAKGNNSGDAYVAGCYLLKKGCKVCALQAVSLEGGSPLCIKNYHRFKQAGGQIEDPSFSFPKQGVILDGFFGTGFKGSLQEPFASIVGRANASKLPILAIDIPSGLNGDTGMTEGKAIQATKTLFLGAPKKGFFINEGWNYVGNLHYIDFGIPKECIDHAPTDMIMLTKDIVQPLLPPIKRGWHKYERGYVTAIAGSPHMPGAAFLSAKAALTAGAGIVRLIHPKEMEAALAAAPVELVRQSYCLQNLEAILEPINKASASYIGPGIGKTEETSYLLKYILKHIKKPCVLDADALTLLSENQAPLPKGLVLTPHHGEMLKLLRIKQEHLTSGKLLDIAQSFTNDKSVTLVLKGAPTFILQPNLPIHVNPRGDAGMATAGSGDVLTGIIAALLAQGLPHPQAAILGVWLHAVAGEQAAKEKTSYCMTASDIITHLPHAYKDLLK
ncbi:Bifunctional NAD(P)H-hydrate repair enzyme Nnr|uniref:NAD(P)H-hydrate dehydratase n=1 Tax=Neochlamydia sp. AcF84 TaxID=2315858 RepID=UPI001408300B|nr:NAD(P)H-hydrate dehydratase [Neochlamydia sp. AcF84]NGY95081.1 Bifunctional NAD(P)H-hydrate repair enzyme Nnr [Neochlamydia sp. AcF84]